MRIAPEVAEALADGRPVVALESTLVSHGLPRPRNLDVAHEVEEAVRAGGAVPATIAVVAGEARVGLDEEALAVVAGGDVVKCGVRDLAPVAARGGHGATTVASTAHRPRAAGSACSPPAGSAACTAAPARATTSRRTSRRSPGPGSWWYAPG